MDEIGKLRRTHFREGRLIKGIGRNLSISRTMVRRVLRSGATSLSYERQTQPRPKIGPWQSELEGMLSANASRPKRERLTMMRMFEDLRVLGYEGGYDAVRRHVARWRADREAGLASETHVPLTFDPGEVHQFDWSNEDAVLGVSLFA